jgi:hypothetical protein
MMPSISNGCRSKQRKPSNVCFERIEGDFVCVFFLWEIEGGNGGEGGGDEMGERCVIEIKSIFFFSLKQGL